MTSFSGTLTQKITELADYFCTTCHNNDAVCKSLFCEFNFCVFTYRRYIFTLFGCIFLTDCMSLKKTVLKKLYLFLKMYNVTGKRENIEIHMQNTPDNAGNLIINEKNKCFSFLFKKPRKTFILFVDNQIIAFNSCTFTALLIYRTINYCHM